MASDFIKICLGSLDSEMLEELVLHYANETHNPQPPAQRIGVSGQSQNGVDVYAHVSGLGHIGFQSKAYISTKLTPGSLDKELRDCHDFSPTLDYYTLVTLKSRDAKLQQHARNALLHGQPNRVSVIALEDLASIVMGSPSLSASVIQYALRHSDIGVIREYLSPIIGTTSSLSTQEIDQSLPHDLKSAEEWIDNGMPIRALAILDAYTESAHRSSATRIRCRALYSLGRYTDVLTIAEKESNAISANAATVILGALAASELGNAELSETLSQSALGAVNDATRKDAVGGYIRLTAKRPGATISALEAIAVEHLGSGEKVAVALADAAASIGDRRRAAHWFQVARQSRPSVSLAVQINEIATSLVIAIDESDEQALTRLVARLEQLLDSASDIEAPSFRPVILTNLGAAYRATGRCRDAATAWDAALADADDQRDLWLRRCMLGEQDAAVQPPNEALASKYAVDPLGKLAFASALISADRVDEARALIDDVLRVDDVYPLDQSVARVEQLRIRWRSDDQQQVISDAITYASEAVEPLPLVGWLALHYRRASRENKLRLDQLLGHLDPGDLNEDVILAIATPITTETSGVMLGGWIPRLKAISFDDLGRVSSEQAAAVLAEIQADTLDYSGCIFTLEKIREIDPDSTQTLLRLAQAHYEAGDRLKSLELLQDAVASSIVSALTVRNWAHLSTSLGRRREARRFFASISKPTLSSANDYLWMMQARMILGIKDDDADAIEFLRHGMVTPERASQVFALGIHRKSNHPAQTVGDGTIIHIRIEDEINDTYFVSTSKGVHLPGIRTLTPASHPWVDQVVGQKAGVQVTLAGEPFDGKIAEVLSVSGVSDFVFTEAVRQIGLSTKEKTGVQKITGSLELHLDEARKQLVARHKEIEERLDFATRGHFPISLMVKQFHTSPRSFLQAQKTWAPRSHTGTAADIQADEKILDRSSGWTFDATTILLLAAIGADDFPYRLARLPRIARTTVAQLCDRRAEERDQRRVVAHMNVDDEGNLYTVAATASDRTAMLAFWKKVDKIVTQCRIIDVPTVGLSETAVELLDILGSEAFATFNTAKFHGLTLVAEEFNVRAFATAASGVDCVPLHALIVEAFRHSWITAHQAMLWVSRLIDLGWTWVWFPSDWLWECMRLPEEDRWTVMRSLSSRMQRADPGIAAKTIFTALTLLDNGHLLRSERERFRGLAIASFPPLDQPIRNRIVQAYRSGTHKHGESSRTVQSLKEWARNGVAPPLL